MKSLIAKDLLNIKHNAKSMLLILLIFAVALIPTSGIEGYIIVSANLCSMMIVTTFAFDDNSKWTRYAMIMPVSKKDLVASKFIVLSIFSMIGAVLGLIFGVVIGTITSKLTWNVTSIYELLLLTLASFSIAMAFGGISIPLVFKFGAEKGRVLLFISFLIPAIFVYGVYKLLSFLNIVLTEQFILILLWLSPVIAFVWNYIMFVISNKIFIAKEL